MFNPQTGSPTSHYFQQQATFNPFAQMQVQATGMPFAGGMGGQPVMGLQPQATGMMAFAQMGVQPAPTGAPFGGGLQPQATGFPATAHNPFSQGMPQMQAPQQQGSPFQQQQGPPFQQQQQQQVPNSSPFGNLQPQPTGFAMGGGLQPQATGANPFRASVLAPQATGFPAFGGAQNSSGANLFGSPALNQGQPQGQGQGGMGASPFGAAGFGSNTGAGSSPFASIAQPTATASNGASAGGPFARPASAPLTSHFGSGATSPPPAQPVKTHQTGSRNPFGPVVQPEKVPPVPKVPTMMELAMGLANNNNAGGMNGMQSQPTGFPGAGSGLQSQPTGFPSSTTGSSLFGGAGGQNGSAMSGIASSFALGNNNNKPSGGPTSPLFSQNTATTTTGSLSDSLFSLSLSSQPTGATTTASTTGSMFSPSISVSPPPGVGGLKPQATGMSGLKPFKPSSSFGASLLETLPPIPQSAPNTPAATGSPAASPLDSAQSGSSAGSPSVSNTSSFSSLGAQPTSFGAFGGLGSQPTGLGALNASSSTLGSNGGMNTFGGSSSLGVGLRPQMTGGMGAANPFRASMAGSPPPGATGGNMFGGGAPAPSFGGSMFAQTTGMPGGTSTFGSSMFGSSSAFGSTSPGQQQQPQQPQQPASLI
jgi:phosphatidylinositol-binding clathrin assembly protein